MSKFRVGDHVVCIDADGTEMLQYGYDYIITGYFPETWNVRFMKNVPGVTVAGAIADGADVFGAYRFRLRGVAASEAIRLTATQHGQGGANG